MKKLFVMLGVFSVICLSAGCKKKSPQPDITPTAVPTAAITITPIDSVTPGKTKELPIYTIGEDQRELTAVTVLVTAEKELSQEIVAEAVVDALADSAFYVKVNSVTSFFSKIIVDFDSSAPPVKGVSRDLEELILDSFAMSIIDNIPGCNEVGFSVDGKDYKSSYLKMEYGTAYLRR